MHRACPSCLLLAVLLWCSHADLLGGPTRTRVAHGVPQPRRVLWAAAALVIQTQLPGLCANVC